MTAVRPETPSPSTAARCQVFSAADPVSAHAYICRTYVETSIRLIGDQTNLRMRDERHDLGPFSIEDFTYTAGLQQLVPPIGRLMIAKVIAGRWQRSTIGEERRLGHGDVCLVTQPDRPHLSRWDTGVKLQIITLDPSVLLDLAAAPGDVVPRFTALTPSPGGGRLISAAMDHAVATAIGHPPTALSPVVRRDIARRLASALLEALPNTAGRDPVIRNRVDATHSRVLRTALAYVHDHAHEDIAVSDLAEAAGASRQAVHLAFRKHLQTTPLAYLERVRLDRAHRDLTDLGPESTTVEQLALLWGFSRLDRFRRSYQHLYGTSPEQTLRN